MGPWGYAVVARNLAKGLRDAGHEVIIYGMQTLGKAIPDQYGTINLPVRFTAYGEDILANYVRAYNIDLVITICDLWHKEAQHLPNVIKALGVAWIAHATINSVPLTPMLGTSFKDSEWVIAPSKFCEITMKEGGINKVSTIPHGVDLKLFYPSETERGEMRKRLGLGDKFVLLCVQRNNSLHKNIIGVMNSYRLFLDRNPEAREKSILVMLSDAEEPASGNLLQARQLLGLKDNVRFIGFEPTEDWKDIKMLLEPDGVPHSCHFGFNEGEMRGLYNAADCLINLSSGESFGLPSLESMACGVPQIGVNFSATPELIEAGKAGLMTPVRAYLPQTTLSNIAIPDLIIAADHIEKMYKDVDARKEYGKNAAEFAKNFSWDKVIPLWVELIKKVEDAIFTADYANLRLGL